MEQIFLFNLIAHMTQVYEALTYFCKVFIGSISIVSLLHQNIILYVFLKQFKAIWCLTCDLRTCGSQQGFDTRTLDF